MKDSPNNTKIHNRVKKGSKKSVLSKKLFLLLITIITTNDPLLFQGQQ